MPRHKPKTAALMASPDDVEAQFYEALREGDLNRLMALWAEDEDVFCVHPGGARLCGVAAVRSAFEALFANGSISVRPENVRRVHALGTAVHSVMERIDIATAEGPRVGWVMATNVYLKTAQGWRLVAHHASPGSPDAPPEPVEPTGMLH